MLHPNLLRFVAVVGLLLAAATLPIVPAAASDDPPRCGGRIATIVGTEGDDVLTGTPGGDVIVGLGGNDTILGRQGPDRICGGGGRDILDGEGGRDRLFGGPGNDVLRGGTRDDGLDGGKGRDGLYGGAGVDHLDGRSAVDLCIGGETERGCERGALDPAEAAEVSRVPSGFSADDFQCLGDVIVPPATSRPTGPPAITNDPSADARIRRLAEARGYRLRPLVDRAALVGVDGQTLHPEAAAAWKAMQADAAGQGVGMTLWSGYRSPTTQRFIFTNKLLSAGFAAIGRPYTNAEIASGAADAAIESILRLSSIPGYSRHHTGSTVDILAPGGTPAGFPSSPAFAWLSAANYANARRHGFVPSYPPGAGLQGPDPEAWEYVYVGRASAQRRGGGFAFGKLEQSSAPDRVRVRGWAYDPSRPDRTVVVEIHAGTQPIAERRAHQTHFELGAARPRLGHLHGYGSTIAAPGRDDICVVVRDLENPAAVRLIGSLRR